MLSKQVTDREGIRQWSMDWLGKIRLNPAQAIKTPGTADGVVDQAPGFQKMLPFRSFF